MRTQFQEETCSLPCSGPATVNPKENNKTPP